MFRRLCLDGCPGCGCRRCRGGGRISHAAIVMTAADAVPAASESRAAVSAVAEAIVGWDGRVAELIGGDGDGDRLARGAICSGKADRVDRGAVGFVENADGLRVGDGAGESVGRCQGLQLGLRGLRDRREGAGRFVGKAGDGAGRVNGNCGAAVVAALADVSGCSVAIGRDKMLEMLDEDRCWTDVGRGLEPWFVSRYPLFALET